MSRTFLYLSLASCFQFITELHHYLSKKGFYLQNREVLVLVDEFSVGGGMGANIQNPPGE
jgi:hypothetical protein